MINNSSTANTRTMYGNPYGKIGQSFLCEIHLASGWQHQYVHELKSVVVNFTRPVGEIDIKSFLYLVLKFEYKKHKGWREATAELRNIYINLNILKRNLLQVNRTQEFLIQTDEIDSYNTSGPGHSINITGTIRHEVIGRTDSRRENNWTIPRVPEVYQAWRSY